MKLFLPNNLFDYVAPGLWWNIINIIFSIVINFTFFRKTKKSNLYKTIILLIIPIFFGMLSTMVNLLLLQNHYVNFGDTHSFGYDLIEILYTTYNGIVLSVILLFCIIVRRWRQLLVLGNTSPPGNGNSAVPPPV